MIDKNGKKIVAVIPARGGSKGLPRKNIRELLGKPLIAWTIEFALSCELIDRVIVSTEDEEIADIAKEYGAEVPFRRPEELALDDISSEEVLKHTVEWLEENEKYRTDIVVYLQITDIFRKRYMMDSVIEALLKDDTIDSAFVAYKDHKNYWRKVDGKWMRLTERGYLPRQKKEYLFREDTGLACATRASIVKDGRRLGDNVVIIENDDTASAIDIHTEFELWLVETILRSGKRTIND